MTTATASRPRTRERPRVIWRPHPGSQALFLSCPHREALYTGTRGPGKTDALLMDFAQHVGQGYGEHWRGVLFRREYKPLSEVIAKSRRWFRRIFPEADFKQGAGELRWVWPDGEELLLRAIKRLDQYWDYHGHEYPWIGWDELTAWPDLRLYHLLKSCNRSSHPTVPRKYRATCNPYGPGHNAVKAYHIDPAVARPVRGVRVNGPFVPDLSHLAEVLQEVGVELQEESARQKTVTIHGHYSENRTLMEAQPDYPETIARAAENPEMAKAWLGDDWDITSGGMFDDLWDRGVHILPSVEWPVDKLHSAWRLDRAFDWGDSKPFSVGWWLELDGTEAPDGRVYPRGTLVRFREWYGWDGHTPNTGLRMTDREVGKGMEKREKEWKIHGRTKAGPADTQIFQADSDGKSIHGEYSKYGVTFVEADKSPGTRKTGWSAMRRMLQAAAEGDPEHPHLYVLDCCPQFIRTVPTLPRDDRDPDDVDTEAEDHVADETRYRVLKPKREAKATTFRV